MKAARRGDCPCGSGKKYQNCCQRKGPEITGRSLPFLPVRRMPAASPGSVPLLSYCRHKIMAGLFAKSDPEKHRRCWTAARVAELSTDQVETQLRTFGVEWSPERFGQWSAELDSAWDLSERWFAQDRVTARGMDEDFLGLAACELWKRLRPERPSLEMVDDWLAEGYELEAVDEVAACATWWKAWCALRPRFRADMKTMEAAQSSYRGTVRIFNWCQSFQAALMSAAVRDPKFVELSQRYCREWVGQFGDERADLQVTFHSMLADFTLKGGQVDRARSLLENTLARWPDEPWSYVALADAYSHLFADPKYHLPFDKSLAWQTLNRGLSRLSGEAAQRVLQGRLDALNEAVPVSQKGRG